MSRSDGRVNPVCRALAMGAAVLAGAALLAACGGSSSTTTTTAASGGPTTTAAGSGGSSSKLGALSSSVQNSSKSTYLAVYSSTDGSGGVTTVSFGQAPPKQVFSSTDPSGSTTSILNTGSATYSCSSSSGGASTCTPLGGSLGSSALSGLLSVYNGTAAITTMKAWQSSLAAHLSGVSVTFSDESIAGQASTCANWSQGSDKATYCVTSSGVLAKVETSSGGSSGGVSFVLTSYTGAPPASQFELPAGASVVTLPGGVSAP